MLTEIINNQSIIRIEEGCIQAKLKIIAQETASWIALRNYSKKPWFSAQLCFFVFLFFCFLCGGGGGGGKRVSKRGTFNLMLFSEKTKQSAI